MANTVRNMSGLTRHEQMLENEKKADAQYREEWNLHFAKRANDLGEWKVCTQKVLPKRFKTPKEARDYFDKCDGRTTVLFQDQIIQHKQA